MNPSRRSGPGVSTNRLPMKRLREMLRRKFQGGHSHRASFPLLHTQPLPPTLNPMQQKRQPRSQLARRPLDNGHELRVEAGKPAVNLAAGDFGWVGFLCHAATLPEYLPKIKLCCFHCFSCRDVSAVAGTSWPEHPGKRFPVPLANQPATGLSQTLEQSVAGRVVQVSAPLQPWPQQPR